MGAGSLERIARVPISELLRSGELERVWTRILDGGWLGH